MSRDVDRAGSRIWQLLGLAPYLLTWDMQIVNSNTVNPDKSGSIVEVGGPLLAMVLLLSGSSDGYSVCRQRFNNIFRDTTEPNEAPSQTVVWLW